MNRLMLYIHSYTQKNADGYSFQPLLWLWLLLLLLSFIFEFRSLRFWFWSFLSSFIRSFVWNIQRCCIGNNNKNNNIYEVIGSFKCDSCVGSQTVDAKRSRDSHSCHKHTHIERASGQARMNWNARTLDTQNKVEKTSSNLKWIHK